MNMKKYIYIFLILHNVLWAQDVTLNTVALEVAAKEHSRIDFVVGIIGNDQGLQAIAKYLCKDLAFSNQFSTHYQSLAICPGKKEIKEMYQKKTNSVKPLFALFLSAADDQSIEWRLYNTMTGAMIDGKKYIKKGNVDRGWAHNIADIVWPILTGYSGFFSTKIAYCKELDREGKKSIKHVYIADYDGTHERILIDDPTVHVAPRWNSDPKNPLLFYSAYTNSNVQLKVAHMNGRRKIASNFDGINMLPSFSEDGKTLIYCASRGNGSCQLYYCSKGAFKRITHNNGNNVSPAVAETGVYFCSDFETKSPQLYFYCFANETLERITHDGYCASPAYCASQKKLAYTKRHEGIMQLFLYDTTTKKHTLLTTSPGHKQECSWSACGHHLLFCEENDNKNRIAMLDVLSGKKRYITPAHENCSYPAWSGSYVTFVA